MRAFTLALLLLSGTAEAAPLPFARPRPALPSRPAVVCGLVYRLQWYGSCFEAVFRPDNTWECYAHGDPVPLYGGTWEDRGGTMHLRDFARSGAELMPWTWHPEKGATLGGLPAPGIRLTLP